MGKMIGSYIRDMREKRGLSQGDVAKLLSLKTAQSISNIERGVSPLPRKKIKRLAEVLGVEKGDMLSIVLSEVQDRVAKAAGVKTKTIVVAETLPNEDLELVHSIVERLSNLKSEKKASLKKQMKRLLEV